MVLATEPSKVTVGESPPPLENVAALVVVPPEPLTVAHPSALPSHLRYVFDVVGAVRNTVLPAPL